MCGMKNIETADWKERKNCSKNESCIRSPDSLINSEITKKIRSFLWILIKIEKKEKFYLKKSEKNFFDHIRVDVVV